MAERGVDLKDEEEVKDYLERLGIEYRFGCYYEKDPKGNGFRKNSVMNSGQIKIAISPKLKLYRK